jgi:bacterioferritin-associated ferredoxin
VIVCHCKGINDRAIRKAVRDGARSRGEVVQACAAGLTCGGCTPAIDEIIQVERNRSLGSSLLGLAEFSTG